MPVYRGTRFPGRTTVVDDPKKPPVDVPIPGAVPLSPEEQAALRGPGQPASPTDKWEELLEQIRRSGEAIPNFCGNGSGALETQFRKTYVIGLEIWLHSSGKGSKATNRPSAGQSNILPLRHTRQVRSECHDQARLWPRYQLRLRWTSLPSSQPMPPWRTCAEVSKENQRPISCKANDPWRERLCLTRNSKEISLSE